MKKLLLAATMLVRLPEARSAGCVVLGSQSWSFTGVDNLTLTR